ncbi:MAG: twin-arginine translocation signal domain-containing protein [Armatimonadetes bacterium]|nr:twin-arginine translocation signal domain-containing protein [Armatimonadota bacterium]
MKNGEEGMDRRDFLVTSAQGAVGLALAARWVSAQEAEDNVPRRYLHCYTHRLDMERGFKFHCLVPERAEGVYGRHEYAGFFTVRVGEEPWVFVGDVPPEHGLVPQTLGDLKQGRFSILRKTPAWRIEQFADWNAMYPATWLSARVQADVAAPITGAVLGWGWAQRRTGTQWFADREALDRAPGGPLQLPAGCSWIGYHDVTEDFSGVLAFTKPPDRAWVDDDGVYWDWGALRTGAMNGAPTRWGAMNRAPTRSTDVGPEPADKATPTVAYILAPGLLSADELNQLARFLAQPPTDFASGVVPTGAPAWMAAEKGTRAIPVPPSLKRLTPDPPNATVLQTAVGDMFLVSQAMISVSLPPAPQIETPLPKLAAPPAVVDEVSRHTADLLAHRQPDGRFVFSEGRTFYDGITCGCLAQVLPVLPDALRRETTEALRKCLDALCDGHQRSPAYNLLVPPEVSSFIETGIDYPEITATLLYAMLAFTLTADAGYAARRGDLIETHLNQIREMSTPEGLAWARADTQHMHLIAESAIGGYIAWCSLYHLGRLLDRPWKSECRSRAALSWAAYRELFRWRPEEYGDAGVINGWSNWCAELSRPEPWAYVQSTWFSYVPFMVYDARDEFNLWRNLREQPWWDYTRTEQSSRQRGYDYANMLALAKAGLWEQDVRRHWEEVAKRPFWFDYFDATPALAVAALPQLAGMGVVG